MDITSYYLVGSIITALFLCSFMLNTNYLKEITEDKPYLYAAALLFLLGLCAIGGYIFSAYSFLVMEYDSVPVPVI